MKLERFSANGFNGKQYTFNYKGKRSKQALFTACYGASKKKVARSIGLRRTNVLFKAMGLSKHLTIKSTKVGI